MKRRKWLWLIPAALLIYGWAKLFYKSYDHTVVVKRADMVVAIDVKRIIQTEIWQVLTTPSRWTFGSGSDTDEGPAVDDMIDIPDYVFIFHPNNQPPGAWYCVVNINDEKDFEQGLHKYHFQQNGQLYRSELLHLSLWKQDRQILIGTFTNDSTQLIEQVANELFVQRQHIGREALQRNIAAASHLSLQSLGRFLPGQIITANYDKTDIRISTNFKADERDVIGNQPLHYADSALCAISWATPLPAIPPMLPATFRERMNATLNVDIDSFLLQPNQTYKLEIAGMQSRTDSAVSYSYDDNFNPVTTVVANQVEEPAISFTSTGPATKELYNYLHRSDKLSPDSSGEWFTPIPFVKTWCTMPASNQLLIQSGNYPAAKNTSIANGLLYGRINFDKLQMQLGKYLPPAATSMIARFSFAELILDKKNDHIEVMLSIRKKNPTAPLWN